MNGVWDFQALLQCVSGGQLVSSSACTLTWKYFYSVHSPPRPCWDTSRLFLFASTELNISCCGRFNCNLLGGTRSVEGAINASAIAKRWEQ